MDFIQGHASRASDIVALFEATFTASEGAEEGAVIGNLVREMFADVPEVEIAVFSAVDDGRLVGAVVFTAMDYPQDGRRVMILSPMAVATDRQGEGIGQRLIRHGLDDLRARGVDVVLTYGDPAFYSRVGFAVITEEDARPPVPLQYPEGWLGQVLAGGAFVPLIGPSRCVAPLARPEYW
jgi:putative acetyltransferase